MKKVVCLALAVLMVAAMFVGCTQNAAGGAMKDGTYKASYKNPSHGWIDYVTITVADGKFTEVDFDATNVEDPTKLKSQDDEYETAMIGANKENGLPEIGPKTYFKAYEDELLKAQDIAKVEAVAGATNSGNDFKALAGALKDNMAKGDTAEVIVENAAE